MRTHHGAYFKRRRRFPHSELRRRPRELPSDKLVVAYCRGSYCAFAHTAIEVLQRRAFKAERLEDGLPEWKAADLPVAAGR